MNNEQQLSHLDRRGEAHMVDVGDKQVTQRVAVARSKIRMASETLLALEASELKKRRRAGNRKNRSDSSRKKDE